MSMYYKFENVQYLYKDQYGKHIFKASSDHSETLDKLIEKIKKYDSLMPVVKANDSYIIKFNDTKHVYKARVFYDLIYFIHKTINVKNKKTYVNLHITDMMQKGYKELTLTSMEDI